MSRVHQSAPPYTIDYPDPAEAVLVLRRITWAQEDDSPQRVTVCTNMVQQLWLWPDVGFGWGADRRGGTTLALALLDLAMPAAPGIVCDEWHRPLACSPWAYRLAWMLYEQRLARLDYWGALIPTCRVRQWADAQCRAWDGPGVDLSHRTPLEVFRAPD